MKQAMTLLPKKRRKNPKIPVVLFVFRNPSKIPLFCPTVVTHFVLVVYKTGKGSPIPKSDFTAATTISPENPNSQNVRPVEQKPRISYAPCTKPPSYMRPGPTTRISVTMSNENTKSLLSKSSTRSILLRQWMHAKKFKRYSLGQKFSSNSIDQRKHSKPSRRLKFYTRKELKIEMRC